MKMLREIVLVCVALSVFAAAGTANSTPPTGERKLKASEKSTTLESITIEGEDRVHVEFEHPELRLDLDPRTAAGLEWEFVWALLDRGDLGLERPLYAGSADDPSPFMPRPWLNEFRAGEVARFRPNLKDVQKWKLTIADSRAQTVALFEGAGKPPKEIGWDGRGKDGAPVAPGLTYSYVLEAMDEAGNKRSFVGDSFELPAYAHESSEAVTLLFSGKALDAAEPGLVAPVVLDAATRLNQIGSARSPVKVHVTAQHFQDAKAISDVVVAQLRTLLLGDPSRIAATTDVKPGAPERGSVTVSVAKR